MKPNVSSSILEPWSRAALLALPVGVLALLAGCGDGLGTCTVECRTESGGLNTHGPYEDYTESECDDAAATETTILQTCTADWEAY